MVGPRFRLTALLLVVAGALIVVEATGPRRPLALAGVVMLVGLALATSRSGQRETAKAERAASAKISRLAHRNELILAAAGEGIIGIDAAGRVTVANPAAVELLAAEAAVIRGEDLHRLLHGRGHCDQTCFVPSLLLRSDEWRASTTLRRDDGGLRLIEMNGAPVDEEDSPVAAVVVLRDDTDRREAEERFRAAFEHAPIGMALIAANGGFLQVNRALSDLTGYWPFELCATSMPALTHPHDRDNDRVQFAELVAGDLPTYRAEKRFVRKDGRAVWTLCNLTMVRAADGSPSYVIAQIEDVTDRRETEALLAHQALHDPLTGLANRVLLADRLEHALAAAQRREERVGLLFIDLDRFKLVNDTYGHDAGDRLLVEIGRRLRGATRPSDTAARVGGDEFVILCEDLADPTAPLALSHRLQAEITRPVQLAGATVSVSCSIGVVVSSSDDDRAESLLRDADSAMYRAKERGRGRIELFDESLRAQVATRLRIESALRRALEDEQVLLCYQPTVDLRTRRYEGAEALLRWRHPELGVLEPLTFLSVAEETGLIVPLGHWVLEEACRQVALWRRSGRDLRVAVNLSARQLDGSGLVDQVLGVLEAHDLPPQALRLELTETVLAEASSSTLSDLGALTAQGVSLGIDDFGTGYSSMTYLKRFPVDFIKIDRSFVAGAGSDREDTAIVAATIALGRALGLTTIAEGVETSEQAKLLIELGCDLAQGYLYGPPAPPKDVTALLLSDAAIP